MTEASSTPIQSFQPIRLFEVELSQPLPTLTSFDAKTEQHYRQARMLVRLHATPLGLVDLELTEELTPQDYVGAIWHSLHESINRHLQSDGLTELASLGIEGVPSQEAPACVLTRAQHLTDAPFTSVVVCTHERADQLRNCLESLSALIYPNYEIIVVDNAPRTSATADVVQREFAHLPNLRYVRENKQGLSWARNCGLACAQGSYIAFTDDDVLTDSYWLAGLTQGFSAADRVACVTGLTLPAELETRAQLWFEQFGGFSRGFKRRIFDLETTPQEDRLGGPLYPYSTGRFGSGNSMAFETAFLREVGGFDSALGAGTPTQGGEDLAAFFQVIARGRSLIYEPSAINFHVHRRNQGELRKQMYGYGTGLSAYLTSTLLGAPGRIFELIARTPNGLTYMLSADSPKNRQRSDGYPTGLVILELWGVLHGPFTYFLSLYRQRRQVNPNPQAPLKYEAPNK